MSCYPLALFLLQAMRVGEGRRVADRLLGLLEVRGGMEEAWRGSLFGWIGEKGGGGGGGR